MPKSATDATRFTSTTPQASAKSLPSTHPQKTTTKPGPPGETTAQKIRRLKDARDSARNAQVPVIDRMLVKGRVVADWAHKITAMTLITATFIAGGVCVYALGDMMIYNRRKRAEFFAEQKAIQDSTVATVRSRVRAGTASAADIRFIKLEDEHLAQLKAKAEQKNAYQKGKAWLFSGLKKEEEGDDVGTSEKRLGYEALSEEDDVLGERESDILRAIEDKKQRDVEVELEIRENVEEKKAFMADKAKQAFESEKERQRTGGVLDRIGTAPSPKTNVIEQPKSNGWFSWMTGR